jgi:hypothetical protein
MGVGRMKTLLVQHSAGAALEFSRGVKGHHKPVRSLALTPHVRLPKPNCMCSSVAVCFRWNAHSVGTASCWHSTDVSWKGPIGHHTSVRSLAFTPGASTFGI